jgi:hypothetical protein
MIIHPKQLHHFPDGQTKKIPGGIDFCVRGGILFKCYTMDISGIILLLGTTPPVRNPAMIPSDSETFLLPALLSRLERISADSHCAHLASGIRGALLRAQDRIETGRRVDERRLRKLIEQGFDILEAAALEKIGIR